jgi:outer membrane protein TolC
MQATEEILKAQTNLAEVTEKQLAIGTVSKVDVTSQRTLVSNSQVDLFTYERNLSFARNQLAVLVGELPSNANITKFDLKSLHLPEKLPLSVPSSLVRQRPDVRAAEAQLNLILRAPLVLRPSLVAHCLDLMLPYGQWLGVSFSHSFKVASYWLNAAVL